MPFLGTRGSGSSKALGRAAKVAITSLSDNFDRTTSNTLGVPSGRGISWRNQRGIWSTNGSIATSATDKSTNSIATILTASSTISNLQVDTENTGGVGLAFWVVDADNWWAATTGYATTPGSSSTTTTTCNGGGALDLFTRPASCCAGNYSQTAQYVDTRCNNGTFQRLWGVPSPPASGHLVCHTRGGYDYKRSYTGTALGCTTTNVTNTQTTTWTNYLANFKLINNGNVVVNTQYNTNTSSFSTIGSMAISTSGNTISYSVYSGSNKGGSLLHSGSYTASNPVKGRNVGIFKGDGGSSQGSNLNNFSVTVVP